MSDLKDPIENNDEDDEVLADQIRDLWKGDVSSLRLCHELNINLGRFNRIITKYNIAKELPDRGY